MNSILRPLRALIWKDAKVFASDRQAIVMSVVIPVLIATILGWLDSSASDPSSNRKTPVLLVDQDATPTSKEVDSALAKDSKLVVTVVSESDALKAVKDGKSPVAIVIPKGFESLALSIEDRHPKPSIRILEDPSEQYAPQLVEAEVYEHASRTIASILAPGFADTGAPVKLEEEPVAAAKVTWAQSAHDYSGFGLQGLLFFAVESAVLLGKERRSGVWRRLRCSPVSSQLILFSRGASSAVLALSIILLMFCVGALLFHIRVLGSYLGFFSLAIAAAIMTAAFGLLMSTLGKTETQSRALSILIIFVMLATGGAWFPLSRMPDVVQNAAKFMPVRWAVEGFDGVTWRGLPLADALKNVSILLAFAIFFTGASLLRFAKLRNDTA